MEYCYSDKMKNLKPSAVREILKAASTPGMIPFAAGNPAPEAFPVTTVQQITEQLMHSDPVALLQYGVTEGYTPLLRQIAELLTTRQKIGREFDSVLITSGAQQVMDLATKVLCNEGDTILCETPSFIGSLNCFRSYNTNLVGIDMEEDGINLCQLEDRLQNERNIRFIYVIPNFQNPSGVTMSLEKRRAVYALARQYGVMILEDDPYGYLRVRGEHIPSIKSMDEDGIVIYAGSFSKLLAPGIRVGYAVAPKPILAKMTVGKQTSDVHTPMFSQMLVSKWLEQIDFNDHIVTISDIYRRKLDLMCELINSQMRGFFQYQKPEGGLFIWCRLPDKVDMTTFCTQALKRSVAVVPGTAFLVDDSKPTSYVRLNFSTPPDAQIIEGMKILGKLRDKYVQRMAELNGEG